MKAEPMKNNIILGNQTDKTGGKAPDIPTVLENPNSII